jgi:polyisoprenoid-binding protein YceI
MKNLTLSLTLLTALAIYLAPASQSTMEATAYKIDPVHSSVHFCIAHLGVSHTWGRFNKVSGKLSFAPGGEGSSIEVSADAGSVDTNDKMRDTHLKGPDFFSAGEFGTISFKSKSWKKSGDDTFDVTGDLTMHGQTNSVTVKVKKIGEGDKGPKFGYRIGFAGELTIKRSEYGMNKMLKFVGDDVKLHIAIEAMK